MKDKTLTRKLNGISGSRIAAVAGLSPFLTVHDVWMEIFGLKPESEKTPDLLRGIHLGPAICRWYQDITKTKVLYVGSREKLYVHPEEPIVYCHPDGVIKKQDKAIKVLEVKCPRFSNDWGEPGTDQIPEYYLPQVMWECACVQVSECDVASLLNSDLNIYTVRYDPELFRALVEIAKKFWAEYVETQTPPPVDASTSARNMLMRLYPRPKSANMIDATVEQRDMLVRYAGYKKEMDDIRQKMVEIENILMASISDEYEGIKSDIATVKWSVRHKPPRYKDIAEYFLSRLDESEKNKILQQYKPEEYRHFQIYLKKGGSYE